LQPLKNWKSLINNNTPAKLYIYILKLDVI
jgi:hypothetical protein